MICVRCGRPIETGQIYHQSHRRRETTADDDAVYVHDYPCPTGIAIVDGRVLINGIDIGPESRYNPPPPMDPWPLPDTPPQSS